MFSDCIQRLWRKSEVKLCVFGGQRRVKLILMVKMPSITVRIWQFTVDSEEAELRFFWQVHEVRVTCSSKTQSKTWFGDNTVFAKIQLWKGIVEV